MKDIKKKEKQKVGNYGLFINKQKYLNNIYCGYLYFIIILLLE